MLLVWGGIFGAIFVSHFVSSLPDVRNLLATGPSQDITILDDQGLLIARRGLTQGRMVAVGDLPDFVPNAFIAIEDRRFRSHFGVDPIGMGRAFVQNMMKGHVVQGGVLGGGQTARKGKSGHNARPSGDGRYLFHSNHGI